MVRGHCDALNRNPAMGYNAHISPFWSTTEISSGVYTKQTTTQVPKGINNDGFQHPRQDVDVGP